MSETIPCPLCHAWVTMECRVTVPMNCPFCRGEFVSTTWDSGGHRLSELKEAEVNLFGAMAVSHHPVGTKVCRNCGRIHPESFSCCPRLVTLAIKTLRKRASEESRNVAFAFLAKHPDVARNVLIGLVARRKLTTDDSLLAEIAQRCGFELIDDSVSRKS